VGTVTAPQKDQRNSWNPPDQRRTGSAGGGVDRSCMVVAAPVAITIGTLLAVAIRRTVR
jgi:hypothetical protein